MGFWDFLKRPVSTVVYEPNVSWIGPIEDSPLALGEQHLSVAKVWRDQPHLRTVVSFLARNTAQVGLHTFERQAEDSRVRDRTSAVARALRKPGDGKSTYDLIFALVGDLALYDRAYWLPWTDTDGSPRLRRLPPSWVTPHSANGFAITSYLVTNNQGGVVELPADAVLDFTGYAPTSVTAGSPTVEALKATIAEQIEATKYRLQTWKRGGRVSSVLQRPKDAPTWSDGAREAFREDWYAAYTGNGTRAGGTPILEDGMTLNRVDFSPAEQQFTEAAKLSLVTCAAAYHINPTMVGVLDNANYSNVREFRRMLYGETLGPLLAQIEGRINTFLLDMLGMDDEVFYVEFNIAEKLEGSFEEQAAVMQTMVGAPILSRNEGRARFNLPRVEGGDDLVTPLNVLVGGQASPTDSGSQNRAGGPLPAAKAAPALPATKGGVTPAQRTQVERVLTAFFDRQGKSVLSAIGAGGDWWDGERWTKELADDLHRVAHTIAAIVGTAEAERLGYADGYDPDRTVKYLATVSERWAGNINATTKAHLDAAIESDEDPAAVFDNAKTSRAVGVAAMVGTFVAGFGVIEAGKQIAYDQGVTPTKTWITGENPRESHAAMNGETVPIEKAFSNGSMWPADGPDVDEVAGCNCSVQIDF